MDENISGHTKTNGSYYLFIIGLIFLHVFLYLFTYGHNKTTVDDDHLGLLSRQINVAQSYEHQSKEFAYPPHSFASKETYPDGHYRSVLSPVKFYIKNGKMIPIRYGEHNSAYFFLILNGLVEIFGSQYGLCAYNLLANSIIMFVFAMMSCHFLGREISVFSTVLLAIDPIFLSFFHLYQDRMLLALLVMITIIFSINTKRWKRFIIGALFGFGLYLKLTYLAYIAAFSLLFPVRKVIQTVRCNWKYFLFGFLLNSIPLIFLSLNTLRYEIFEEHWVTAERTFYYPAKELLNLFADKFNYLKYFTLFEFAPNNVPNYTVLFTFAILIGSGILMWRYKTPGRHLLKRLLLAVLGFATLMAIFLNIVYATQIDYQEYFDSLILIVALIYGVIAADLSNLGSKNKWIKYVIKVLFAFPFLIQSFSWIMSYHELGPHTMLDIRPVRKTVNDLLDRKIFHPFIISGARGDLKARFEFTSEEKITPYYLNSYLEKNITSESDLFDKIGDEVHFILEAGTVHQFNYLCDEDISNRYLKDKRYKIVEQKKYYSNEHLVWCLVSLRKNLEN